MTFNREIKGSLAVSPKQWTKCKRWQCARVGIVIWYISSLSWGTIFIGDMATHKLYNSYNRLGIFLTYPRISWSLVLSVSTTLLHVEDVEPWWPLLFKWRWSGRQPSAWMRWWWSFTQTHFRNMPWGEHLRRVMTLTRDFQCKPCKRGPKCDIKRTCSTCGVPKVPPPTISPHPSKLCVAPSHMERSSALVWPKGDLEDIRDKRPLYELPG